MRKQCKRRVRRVNRAAHLHAVAMNSQESVAEMADRLTMPLPVQLDELRAGHITAEGFAQVAESNLIPHCAAEIIHDRAANDSARDYAMRLHQQAVTAADALCAIYDRKARIGRHVANGDEPKALRVSVESVRELCGIMTHGEMAQALVRAADMADKIVANQRRERLAA